MLKEFTSRDGWYPYAALTLSGNVLYGTDFPHNVGDMKGNEVPLEFFLDYAWDPKGLTVDKIPAWERK